MFSSKPENKNRRNCILKIHKSEFNAMEMEEENSFIRDKSLVSVFDRFMFKLIHWMRSDLSKQSLFWR